ncbi:MAG: hypothetical protein IJT59_07980 [Desulfovibrionaceae bacterium]|nr:hypothetical protein [Desulfovibrionaceae bacterium]
MDQIIEDTRKAIEDAELVWDAESIYANFAKQVVEQRDGDFKSWLDKMKESAESLPSMSCRHPKNRQQPQSQLLFGYI